METGKDTAAATTSASAGLRGVVAAQSAIGDVNGDKGILIYQGYDIHDLAENSTFEETVFLLWNGRLPKADELSDLKKQFQSNYSAPAEVIEFLKQFPKDADPMDVLRTAVSTLDFYDKDGHGTDRETALKTSVKLTAQIPTLVAAWERIRSGKEIIAPDNSLTIAENFLYMLRGEKADADEARIFDVCLILHADHELNASTFTTLIRFEISKPREISETETAAAIIHVDNFGNLITNLESADLPARFTLEIKGKQIKKIRKFYAEAESGELFMIRGSAGFLEIACFQNSAADILEARNEDPVLLKKISPD